jgi:hypothetical protein
MANTYGNNGNRWWVGLNVGEGGSQKTVFGTPSVAALNPFTPSGYESLPSGNASDDAKFAAAASKDKGSTNPTTISVENVQWFNIQGPFTTQAAANAAISAIQKANPAPGVLGQVAKDNSSNPLGAAANAASDISSSVGFLSTLGEANTWIRIAKVVAGGMILIVGLLKLTGADKAIGGAAAKAVKVAPLL